jgi:hypothetical protein
MRYFVAVLSNTQHATKDSDRMDDARQGHQATLPQLAIQGSFEKSSKRV